MELPRNSAGLGKLARELYGGAPFFPRLIQGLRPYICPFEYLADLVPRGSTVLDIGCGCGIMLGFLGVAGRVREGVGFDYASGAIQVAQGMAAHPLIRENSSALVFEHRNVSDDWPRGSFEVVMMIDLMHHVPFHQQRSVFHKAVERVAPGGILLYKDMCRRPLWKASLNRLHDLVLATQWIHYRPIADIDLWGREEGLALTHSAAMTKFFWYGHELRVFQRLSSNSE